MELQFNQQVPQIQNKSDFSQIRSPLNLDSKISQSFQLPKQTCGKFDKKLSDQEIEYSGNTASCGNLLQNIYFKKIKQSNATKKLIFQYKLLSDSRNCDIQIGAIELKNHNFEDMSGVYLLKSQGEIVSEQEIQHCGKQINLICDSTISCNISKKFTLIIHQTISLEKSQQKNKFFVHVPLKNKQGNYRIMARIKNIEIELL